MTLGLIKETNTLPSPGFWLFPADLTVLPLFSRLSRKLHDSKTMAHSRIPNASPNVQTNSRSRTAYLKPKRVPEAKPCPKPEPYAWILSAYPQPNKHTPGSSLNNKGSIKRVWRVAPFPIRRITCIYIFGQPGKVGLSFRLGFFFFSHSSAWRLATWLRRVESIASWWLFLLCVGFLVCDSWWLVVSTAWQSRYTIALFWFFSATLWLSQ